MCIHTHTHKQYQPNTTIKMIFHCLVEGFHSLANTHRRRSVTWLIFEQKNDLKLELLIAGQLILTADPV